MAELLFIVLILFPFPAGFSCFLLRSSHLRLILVGGTVAMLSFCSLFIEKTLFSADPPFYSIYNQFISAGDFLVLLAILFLGLRHRHWIIIVLSVCQTGVLAYLEFFVMHGEAAYPPFYVDSLSLVLVRVVCLVGGLICLFAIPYMKAHEEHLQLSGTKQHVFFAVLLLFLGAMNGLVLTNDMLHFYFFFELTTLCSFLLISHDGTEEAVRNGLTALWMNSLGGLFLLLAIWGLYVKYASTDIQLLSRISFVGAAAILPLGLLIPAAFAKSAQLPFQKWLLGAMIAPTPVSALLHSSTMVKAGAYLVLRFSPAFSGTLLAEGLTLAGGFVFLAAAVLAVGQQNAKKVLAYSTISNLGLIFACAGIGTPAAIMAGILLILFHAVSKGLLFLCVGAAEQHLHSRDMEVMRGLYRHMPLTVLCVQLAMVTLVMPPFGMLVGKWLVLEAGAGNIVFFVLVALGSAVTVLYWVRLAGTLLGIGAPGTFIPEKKPVLIIFPLSALCLAAVGLGFCSPWLAGWVSAPGRQFGAHELSAVDVSGSPEFITFLPLFAITVLVGLWATLAAWKAMKKKSATPYMSGANSRTAGEFLGPMKKSIFAASGNYYLLPFLGEERLTVWINIAACGLLLFMLTGDLWR
ncbi:MAG: proton-conducting transporter membrane subunit [Pseudomonadota bacterium]